jgi:hypothetical protein
MGHDGGIVDGVDGRQIMLGIDGKGFHQSVERGAVVAVIGALHVPRRIAVEPCDGHHILGDEGIDLREQIAFARVEGVVEVEHPICDVVECGDGRGHLVHDPHYAANR